MDRIYKVLGKGGKCCNGGIGEWFLPTKTKKGKWMPKIKGALSPCSNGYHLCRGKDLLEWLNEEIYEVEYKGKLVEDHNKVVVSQARLIRKCESWNEKSARLFAVKCAKRSLKIWDRYYSKDKRPHEAVKQAYLFALGKTTKEKMAAAWAAAWDAEKKWQIKILLKILNKGG